MKRKIDDKKIGATIDKVIADKKFRRILNVTGAEEINPSKWREFYKKHCGYVFLLAEFTSKKKAFKEAFGSSVDVVGIIHESFEYGMILIPEIGTYFTLSEAMNDFQNDEGTYTITLTDAKSGAEFTFVVEMWRVSLLLDVLKANIGDSL